MLSLESTGSRMNHIARQEIYFGRQFGLDEITSGIESVTAHDVPRIASDLFKGPLHASVLGNLKGYRPKAAQLRI
jgi:predicted Zn-dependent peptidase